MAGTVSILGMNFEVVVRECRLAINNARLITGTPTTGKTTVCGILRTLAFPVLESDEYVRVFAPEWNRDRLWLRKDDVRKEFELRMRSGFARAAVRCLLTPRGCVVTNWMGDDIVPYLQEHAYGDSPDIDAAVALQAAGLQFRRAATGGTILSGLPVVFVRTSAADVQRLSAGRQGGGTWVGGIPESLVKKWVHYWNPMDLGDRFVRMVYLGLPTNDNTDIVRRLENCSASGKVVFASPLDTRRFLCRLSETFENSRGEPVCADYFFVAAGAEDQLVVSNDVDDLFIGDVVHAMYGHYARDGQFYFGPVTVEGSAQAVERRRLQGG